MTKSAVQGKMKKARKSEATTSPDAEVTKSAADKSTVSVSVADDKNGQAAPPKDTSMKKTRKRKRKHSRKSKSDQSAINGSPKKAKVIDGNGSRESDVEIDTASLDGEVPDLNKPVELHPEDNKQLSRKLRKALNGGKFTKFFTKKFCFSNHYPCPKLEIDGVDFGCTEQYYMYMKAVTFNDEKSKKKILKSSDPKEQKLIGAEVKGFTQSGWDAVARDVMIKANTAKYEQNEHFRQELFRTSGTILVETNDTDIRWGVGRAIDDPRADRLKTWRGQNWLGFILSNIREQLRPKFEKEFAAVTKKESANEFDHPIGVIKKS